MCPFCAGGECEERRRENEQRGRVYVFSPSLLIINVSQVCKIASRSSLLNPPFFLSPSGFPLFLFTLSSLHLPHGVGYLTPLNLNLSPNTTLTLLLLCALNANTLTGKQGNKRPAKMPTMTPSS